MIAIILLIAILAGCSGPFYLNTLGYEINHYPLEQAWRMTATNTSHHVYTSDSLTGQWKSPAQFDEDGGGDCEDFCIYMIYLLGPGANMVIIDIPDNDKDHAIVEYNGIYLDPQTYSHFYNRAFLHVIDTYDYYYLMETATLWGTRSIEKYNIAAQ